MKNQRGHFDFTLLYWIAGAAGTALTSGGLWLLWIAFRGLTT